MQSMTPDERRSFLLDRPRTAKLATVRADGRPHVAPVWFDLDEDGAFVFTTWHTTVKAKNLRRSGWASLCVDEEAPPFAFVIAEGTVSMQDDAPDLLRWSTRIGGRYMGRDRADEFGRRNGVPGELLVRLTPQRIVSAKDVAN